MPKRVAHGSLFGLDLNWPKSANKDFQANCRRSHCFLRSRFPLVESGHALPVRPGGKLRYAGSSDQSTGIRTMRPWTSYCMPWPYALQSQTRLQARTDRRTPRLGCLPPVGRRRDAASQVKPSSCFTCEDMTEEEFLQVMHQLRFYPARCRASVCEEVPCEVCSNPGQGRAASHSGRWFKLLLREARSP